MACFFAYTTVTEFWKLSNICQSYERMYHSGSNVFLTHSVPLWLKMAVHCTDKQWTNHHFKQHLFPEHVSGAWAPKTPLHAQAYFCNPRSPLRSRYVTSRFALRSRSIVFCYARSAPLHPIFGPLRHVFWSSHAPLTCSACSSQKQWFVFDVTWLGSLLQKKSLLHTCCDRHRPTVNTMSTRDRIQRLTTEITDHIVVIIVLFY